MHWEVIRAGGDNLTYLLADPATREAAVVDPLIPEETLARLRHGHWKLTTVLITHGHPDHTGGCPRLVEATGAAVRAHPAEQVAGAKAVRDGEEIPVGGLRLMVLATPGHTPGSVCYRAEDKLLTGDTVFLAGAGNCRFGGNVKDLYRSFRDQILPLDPSLELCPGHDYAQNNLGFAQSLEPDSAALLAKQAEAAKAAAAGNIPASTLAEERSYNPFFRFQEPSLIQGLARAFPELDRGDPEACFNAVRELRNRW